MVQSYISHSISNTLHYSSEIHPYMGEFSYICTNFIEICAVATGQSAGCSDNYLKKYAQINYDETYFRQKPRIDKRRQLL